jgi:chaperonin GroEL
MAKQLAFGGKGRAFLQNGVRILADAVRVTLGPRGRNVMIDKESGAPLSTNDGVTVTKEIEVKDRLRNVGIEMVKEVASKTSDDVGDGTTTAVVLANAIFEEGLKNVAAGADPMAVKRGIDRAVEVAVDTVWSMAKPAKGRKEIEQVATIASGNDPEVGKLIADAIEKTSADGIIACEEAKTVETTVDVVEGMQFDRGYISPYFITDATTMECVMEDALILIHDKKLSSAGDVIPILEKVYQGPNCPLLIVAEDVEGEALATLVVNRIRGTLSVAAVKAPGFGDRRKALLQDMAILTGGEVISEETGKKVENVEIEELGSAKKVRIDKDHTTIIEGGGSPEHIKARAVQLRREMTETTSDYEREKLEERLAKLVGGVSIVRVGAPTEAAMKEKKARVEDALHATRAAAEEGIVPGGGVAFVRAIPRVKRMRLKGDEKIGAQVVERALSAPMRQIADNAGRNGSLVVEKVAGMKQNMGYDAEADKFRDMMLAGIADPAKVVRTSLQNAASIAGLMLTCEAIVAEKPEEEKESHAAHHHHH